MPLTIDQIIARDKAEAAARPNTSALDELNRVLQLAQGHLTQMEFHPSARSNGALKRAQDRVAELTEKRDSELEHLKFCYPGKF